MRRDKLQYEKPSVMRISEGMRCRRQDKRGVAQEPAANQPGAHTLLQFAGRSTEKSLVSGFNKSDTGENAASRDKGT